MAETLGEASVFHGEKRPFPLPPVLVQTALFPCSHFMRPCPALRVLGDSFHLPVVCKC